MSTETACWFCGFTLPPSQAGEVTCQACHRLHFSGQAGEPPQWLPRDPGGHVLEGSVRLTEYGYQGLARYRDTADLVTVTMVRVPEGAARSQLVAAARRVAGLAHVNIVRLRDVGEDGQLFWVAHDRFDGLDLDAWHASVNTSAQPTLSIRLDLLGQAAKGLAFLHSNGLPHGQLYPSNVVVADDGGVRLIYGGLASLATHCSRALPPTGNSPKAFEASPYAAPEVTSDSKVSPAADCYGYGVLAYHLLAGIVPRGRFKALSDLVSGCPLGVSRCVDRCLEVAPSDRPQADQIVCSHFDVNWGSGNSISAEKVLSLLRGFVSRLGSMASGQHADSADAQSGQKLATRIAWEAFSFGLIGMLLGHVLGMVLGTFAMACGFSAGFAVGMHHVISLGSGLMSAAAGLWRERALLLLKSVALGRTFIEVVTAAERYRDPRQKAADVLMRIEGAPAPDQLPLDELRRLLSEADEAIGNLESASLGEETLPAVHRELIQASQRLVTFAAEKALSDRQYGVARKLYARLAALHPDDSKIVSSAAQLSNLLEKHASKIEKLLSDGRLEEAARRLQSLAKHFPQDDMIQELRASYEERHALLNDAKAESLAQLVRDNRWHRIGQITGNLAALNLPLGGYARVVDECRKRDALFAQEQESARVALQRLGPRLATPWLDRLRNVMADHPYVQEFAARLQQVMTSQVEMRQAVDAHVAEGRWIAADNTMRRFLLIHGLGSNSVLDAANNMAGNVQAAWSRWHLLLWFVFAGIGFVVFATLFSTASWENASFSWREKLPIPVKWQAFAGPGLVAGLQFLAAGVVLSVMLTVIGRKSMAFVPIFIGLAIAATAGGVLPPAWDWLRDRSSSSPPRIVGELMEALPILITTVTWLALFTCAAASAAALPSWSPSPLAAVIAIATLYGLEKSQPWAVYLPQAFTAAAVLAIAGISRSVWIWLLMPFACVVASILTTTSDLGAQSALHRDWPPAVALLVAGAFSIGKRRAADYVWLVVAVAWAYAVCSFVRSLDSGDVLLRKATIWMIACGGVAVANKPRLGAGVRIADVIRRYLLGWQCRSTPLQGPVLANTAWFADSRAWHAAHASTAAGASVARSVTGRRGREVARPQE